MPNGISIVVTASDEGRLAALLRRAGRRSHQEFIRFLNTVEAKLPQDKVVDVILNN